MLLGLREGLVVVSDGRTSCLRRGFAQDRRVFAFRLEARHIAVWQKGSNLTSPPSAPHRNLGCSVRASVRSGHHFGYIGPCPYILYPDMLVVGPNK